jgi:hypothetical protein
VSHGLHRLASSATGLDAWREELMAWRLVLPPEGRFTHLTAARVHGWWLPPLPEPVPVHVRVGLTGARPRRSGLVAVRSELAVSRLVSGLPVDPAPEVLLACAWDCSLLDSVVLVDAALHRGCCTREELDLLASTRRRGAPRLRAALRLCDGRSESAWETLLRVLHVVCDVPVEPQYELRDHSGEFVARADLRVCGTNALHEYDGEHHLSRPQQRRDLARSRRIGNETWLRRGYTSDDVLHHAVGVLRDADLSLGRPHRPERVRAWHALLADSCFTPRGRRLLQERFARIGGPGAVEIGQTRQVGGA